MFCRSAICAAILVAGTADAIDETQKAKDAGERAGQAAALSDVTFNAELTKEEIARAKAEIGDDGALWKLQLQVSDEAIRSDLPFPFAIRTNDIATPFESYLLDRSYADGLFGINTAMKSSGPIRTISIPSGNPSWIACTIMGSDGRGIADIFLLGGAVRRLNGHTEAPWALVFGPDASRLVSDSDDGSIRLWDVKKGTQIAKFPGASWPGGGTGPLPLRGPLVDFSSDGKWLATTLGGNISLRNPLDGSEKILWHVDELQTVSEIHFSHDTKTLFAFLAAPAFGPAAAEVFLQFDIDLGEVRRFKGTHGADHGVVLPDEKCVVTWSRSPDVVIWDIATRKELAVLTVAPKEVKDIALSPRGTYLATVGDDNEVKFWDLAKQVRVRSKIAYRVPENDGEKVVISSVRFSPDGRYLATVYSKSDKFWLEVWPAPEFCWNTPQPIVHTEVFADGTIREVAADGYVSYYKPPVAGK